MEWWWTQYSIQTEIWWMSIIAIDGFDELMHSCKENSAA